MSNNNAGAAPLPEDDDQAIDFIVQHLKSEGIFDKMRKDCLQDMDQKVCMILFEPLVPFCIVSTNHNSYFLLSGRICDTDSQNRGIRKALLRQDGVEHRHKQEPVPGAIAADTGRV